jgi:hypothetical protein
MINLTSKIDAVRALYGRDSYSMCDGNGVVVWKDGHETTEAEATAITAKYEELLVEYDAQEYARNRKAEYPDWGTQLNKIYDDGIAKWKSEMVDPIKAKYPKPE